MAGPSRRTLLRAGVVGCAVCRAPAAMSGSFAAGPALPLHLRRALHHIRAGGLGRLLVVRFRVPRVVEPIPSTSDRPAPDRGSTEPGAVLGALGIRTGMAEENLVRLMARAETAGIASSWANRSVDTGRSEPPIQITIEVGGRGRDARSILVYGREGRAEIDAGLRIRMFDANGRRRRG